MKRPSSSPGGLQQSGIKKARLAALQTASAAKVPERRQEDAKCTSVDDKNTEATVGAPPYNTLDATISRGPLHKAWAESSTSTALKTFTQLQQGKQGGKDKQRQPKGRTNDPAAAAFNASQQSALDKLMEQLLQSNPAYAGKSSDTIAAAGLKVRDRSLMLDNPPAAAQGTTPKPAPGYSAQLKPLRSRSDRAMVLPRGTLKYDHMQPLQESWKTYIANLVSCLHTSQPKTPQVQQQQQQSKQQSKNQQKQQNQKQQTEQQQQASSLSLVPDSIVMKSALQADLHGCSLKIVACPNSALVGKRGMVVQVMRTCIVILDRDDKLHVVPHMKTQVQFRIPGISKAVLIMLESMQHPTVPRIVQRKKVKRKGVSTTAPGAVTTMATAAVV